MIEARDLSKSFRVKGGKRLRAVEEVTFDCRPGEIFGLLGINGAGKTTTLRMLATLLTPTGGEGRICGFDIGRRPMEARRRIGFLSTATALYGRLTGLEVVTYFGRLHGMAEGKLTARREELFTALGIHEFQDRRCDQCSTGMKQRISIARSLIHDPEVMIFDEPTLGLDVLAARQITRFIRDCRERGKTVLFSTHVMSEVAKLCDRVAIIHHGRVCDAGSLAELARRHGVDDMEEIFVRAVGETGNMVSLPAGEAVP